MGEETNRELGMAFALAFFTGLAVIFIMESFVRELFRRRGRRDLFPYLLLAAIYAPTLIVSLLWIDHLHGTELGFLFR